MNLADLIDGTDIRLIGGSTRICDITEDSRTVVPGSLFVARQGTKADGRCFIDDALAAGAAAVLTDTPVETPHGQPVLVAPDPARAAAVLAERFYGSPASRLTLVAVTGTNGKTTVAHAVRDLLTAAGRRCGLVGTVEIDDGCERADAAMTTPPAIELSRSLAVMVESGCDAAVIETSSHALDQGRVSALSFDAAVFTNLTGDHQDYHRTPDAYADAKASLFASLDAGATAVVNADDPHADRMVRDCAARVVRCSINDADASVQILEATLHGSMLRLVGPWGAIEARVPMFGAHNAMNVLQAVVAAHALGVDDCTLAAALPRLSPPRGRLQRVADKPAVFIDFAHTDDALRSALTAVRSAMTAGRLWVVFGAGGEKDRTKRPRMGSAAALADHLVVTSDNPRREKPESIIEEILAGVPRSARVTIEPDRARAIQLALAGAEPGDAVVIAGKGHEQDQELPDGLGGTRFIPFDDAAVALEALRTEHTAS